jgi:transducin (beta)-like 1
LGPPAKKARLSNGYENGFDPTAMDIDDDQNQNQNQNQNGDENAYPSPEQLPSPVVATTGPSEGTQIDKVSDLSTDTTFLELSNDPSSSGTVLLQCEFHPQDPTLLAAAGTDALARMWRLSRTVQDPGSDSPGKPIFVSHNNLLDDNVSATSTTVTGISWSPDGSSIAVASDPDDGTAKVEFWYSDGKSFASFNQFDSPITCLRWNPSSTGCLALSPLNEGRSTSITIMSPTMGVSAQFSLPHHSLDDQLLDVAWTPDDEFFLCGGDTLQAFKFVDNTISPGQKLEVPGGHVLSKITYDWRSRMVATASDSGTIDVRPDKLML